MKKYLALLLVCAVLFPLLAGCGVSAAKSDSGDYTVKPFCGAGGTGAIEESRYPCIDNYWTIVFSIKNDEISFGGNLETSTANMKAEMDRRPEGTRVLRPHKTAAAFGLGAEAVIYLDNGVDKSKAAFTAFLEKYHSIGGKLSILNIDLEYVGLSSYYISQSFEKDPLLFNKIVTHPNYVTEVRPLLEERGFSFHNDNNPYITELWPVYDASGEQYAKDRAIWDTVMSIRLKKYLNEAFYEPLMKYYPDAVMFDYQSADSFTWFKELNEFGEINYLGGNAMKAGNTSHKSAYANNPSEVFYRDTKGLATYKNPVAYNNAIYADVPYKMFLWDTIRFKNMYLATDTKKITACIAEYDYNTEREGSVSNTPYYTETILHLGMLDPYPFLLYVYDRNFETNAEYLARLDVIEEILNELSRVAGFSDRKPIVLPVNWNNSFVISGMYAGGRNIWRITPDTTTGMTKETFKVEGTDPTFRINGQTITFPGGKIIEDNTISVVGTNGYWVETSADTVPIIENDATRYEDYPALSIDFENYKPGTAVTGGLALPANTWEVKDNTQKALVVETDKNDPDDQVLAVTGTASMHNTKLPQNITAADSYAKRQAWELTFTAPEKMDADAVITMLGTQKDGGFKVAGGKFYYDQAGEYVEISKVSVIAGATYTLKRTVDFTVEDAFTSSYYIYDAEGKLLGKAENIPTVSFSLPVNKIGFAWENLGDNAACFDDFKLYPVGFSADFDLFGAKLGMQIEDITAAQVGEVAYRYSWMNASDKEETVQIVAQVLDAEGKVTSETVIQELTMKPGCDGVETGIFDTKDTAMVFAVKPVAASKGNFLLYVGIAAAVVLVCAVAAVLIITKKKTAKT